MNSSLAAVAHSIKPVPGYRPESLKDERKLVDACALARSNRTFLAFYLWLREQRAEIPQSILREGEREIRRKELYVEFLTLISEEAHAHDIKFLVFKRKPFPYVGDDIDFYLPDSSNFSAFIEVLACQGLRTIGEGPAARTLGKCVEGIDLVADVHRAFSASYLPYVTGSNVWRRATWTRENGAEFYAPSVEDELLILAGHSLQKELRFNLAELFTAWNLLERADQGALHNIALQEGASGVLRVFLFTTDQIAQSIYGPVSLGTAHDPRGVLMKALLRRVMRTTRLDVRMPFRYPISLVTAIYLIRLADELSLGGRKALSYVCSICKAPFTNREGLGILLNYLRSRL